MKKIFIIGNDTDIGKTYVCGLIAKELQNKKATYFKAAISGIEKTKDKIICDATYVMDKGNFKEDLKNVVPYLYVESYSPHLAARVNDEEISFSIIENTYRNLEKKYDYILAEGSGGIICPLSDSGLMLYDVVKNLNFDVILVSNSGLGAINHSYLTINFLNSQNINCKGIILNNFCKDNIIHRDNLNMIEKLTKKRVLATIKKGGDLKYRNSSFEDLWG